VYGEGAWKVRQHGKRKPRTWRKVPLAICLDSGSGILSKLTDNATSDGYVRETRIQHLPRSTNRFYGDGAYD